jgi:putative tricarboxylic transport membrane protein
LTAPAATIAAERHRTHQETPMRRDTFLKSLAAWRHRLPALAALAAANLKMMIPANPGGGWDTTGRALGKALQEAGVATP